MYAPNICSELRRFQILANQYRNCLCDHSVISDQIALITIQCGLQPN